MSPEDKALLEFEKQRFRYAGAKAQAIRAALDIGETHYYQRLNALLDDPAALTYAPQLINRLRRLRQQRTRRRR